MCFSTRQSKTAPELEKRFRARFPAGQQYQTAQYNGFEHPRTPVITNAEPEQIQLLSWGLIPRWATDESIRTATLNARVETFQHKPAFRDSSANRCMILADGFYEWQWLDPRGRSKQKYLLQLPDHEAFAFAGLWSDWTDTRTGTVRPTYTILTTEANELMSTIHNSKKRMPAIIAAGCEQDWLAGRKIKLMNDLLTAVPV